jgi:DNA-binding FadR family transcriptional regulator
MASSYGVSRSVVREAIRTLAAKGFVVASQGSSSVVAQRTSWSVLDPEFLAVNSGEEFFGHLQEAREILEPSIIVVAVRRIDDEALAELAQRHQEFGEASDPDDHATRDIAFHAAIAEATNNPVLVSLHAMVSGLGYRTRTRSAELPGSIARAAFWHGEILAALQARDADAAESAMRLHLRQVRGELERLRGPEPS